MGHNPGRRRSALRTGLNRVVIDAFCPFFKYLAANGTKIFIYGHGRTLLPLSRLRGFCVSRALFQAFLAAVTAAGKFFFAFDLFVSHALFS
jgi:hypothetical protein